MRQFPPCLDALRSEAAVFSGLVEPRGGIGPQKFADQLTLFQPGQPDYAQHVTTCPAQIFRPSYGPDVYYTVILNNC